MDKKIIAKVKSEISEISYINFPGIYLIKRKSDGKPYVGQTSKSIKERLFQHISNVYVDPEAKGIDAAIQREGADKFTYEVITPLLEAASNQLNFLEGLYINQYDSKKHGFNLTAGNNVKKAKKDKIYNSLHLVSEDITKKIEKDFNLNFRNKSILLIGNFNSDFISYLKYSGCTVDIIDIYYIKDRKNPHGDLIFLDYYYQRRKEMENKNDFDIVISNAPYGKVGAEITRNVINTINYSKFINLLPANDYHKGKDDLYKYCDINTMNHVNSGFTDAAVTTHIADIKKIPYRYMQEYTFEIENYIDPSLSKYFYENYEKSDIFKNIYLPTRELLKSIPIYHSVIFGKRDISHEHLPFSKTTNSYKWNKLESVDANYIINNTAIDFNNTVSIELLIFNSKLEKQNFVDFIYSIDGFRFVSKICTAINCDSRCSLTKVFPKVDWTRSWTVEEILANYGYTEDEIKEVMNDLVNFKYMND